MTLVISALLLAQTLDDGAMLVRRGEYEAARGVLEKVSPGPMRDVLLGIAEANTGRCKIAEPRLGARYEIAELRKLAGNALLQCLLAQDRLNEASTKAQELLREFPDDADLLYQSARLHMRAFNDAVAKMYERAPASYRVNQLSGEILDVQGRPADAAAEYRKAIGKNPNAVNLHYRLGRALLVEGRHDEARKEFVEELKLNPSDAIAEYQIAQIDLVQGQPGAAATRFENALRLKQDFVEAMVALAKLRPAQSIALLEKAVAAAPSHEAARYGLMVAYRNAGRMAEAEAQKAELDRLRKPPEGEFTEFLKRLGEKPKP